MSNYVVTYDLSKPGRNYDDLIKAIKSYDSWAALTESTWLIQTKVLPAQVRDHLTKFLDRNDKLAVISVNLGNWATIGVSTQVTDWMNAA